MKKILKKLTTKKFFFTVAFLCVISYILQSKQFLQIIHNKPCGLFEKQASIGVNVQKNSFFELDASGNIETDDSGIALPKEKTYSFRRSLCLSKTALIIMDPWEDMASNFLNSYYKSIIDEELIPVVKKAKTLGIKIFVLTNKCDAVKYNCKIDSDLKSALIGYQNYEVVYHQNMSTDKFGKYLIKSGISDLIYTGFASNQCVIGRAMGMIPLKTSFKGFRFYFIPEASGAVETKNTWRSKELHKATTKTISQWIGEIILSKDFRTSKKIRA